MRAYSGRLLLALGLALISTTAQAAQRPIDLIRATADKIIGILNDPALPGEPNRAERHRRIREELEVRFDWNMICRSSLGRHWSRISPEQRKEFTDLFKQFLERTYLDRIEPYYNQLDRIEYQGERILENRYASVRTTVITTQKIEHPVEYRLEKSDSGDWRVYDVVIEGVSLTKNYRTQFDEMIAKSSFQGLLDDLKSKIASPPAA
ncbi:MAG: phospholipid-binding protein MlaC [Verrucomicrobiia bacterium]